MSQTGHTPATLSKELGQNQTSQISVWVNNKTEPVWDSAVALAAALRTTPQWILKGDGPTPGSAPNPTNTREQLAATAKRLGVRYRIKANAGASPAELETILMLIKDELAELFSPDPQATYLASIVAEMFIDQVDPGAPPAKNRSHEHREAEG